MPGKRARTTNLLLNPGFNDGGNYWDTLGTVDYSRQSCRVMTGQASQVVSVTAGAPYTLRLWTQVLFKGAGELLIRPNPPATDHRLPLNSFHLWTPQEIRYTPPPLTAFITVALIGTAGEVYADEIHLSPDGSTPGNPELIQNGDFSMFNANWDSSGSPPGAGRHYDGQTFAATLGGQAVQDVSVSANQIYEFDVRARSHFGGHGFARFELLPSGTLPELRLDTSDWMLHRRDLTMPAGTTGCRIILIGINGDNLFDRVSMKLKV